MKDRVSDKVLPNGAVRYGIYGEDGTLTRYEYIKPEDEPTETGTPLNKATLLPDNVCDALGLDRREATPADALLTISKPPMNFCRLVLHVVLPNGTPIAGRKVVGLADVDESKCYTDNNGVLDVYVTGTAYTLTMPQYADVNYIDITVPALTVPTAMGTTFRQTWTAQRLTRAEIKTTQQIVFSPLVADADVFCVGGGGGGGANSFRDEAGSGGGGGYTSTRSGIAVQPNVLYQAIIGAGGSGAYSESDGEGHVNMISYGSPGGTTSFLNVSAAGGGVGSTTRGGAGACGGGGGGNTKYTQAGGNGAADGNGGARGNVDGGAGQGTTTKPFGDTSEPTAYAGGGGGGNGGSATGGLGGSYGGGAGGRSSGYRGSDGMPNSGGGGGGSASWVSRKEDGGGNGGSGIIIVRWRFKA